MRTKRVAGYGPEGDGGRGFVAETIFVLRVQHDVWRFAVVR